MTNGGWDFQVERVNLDGLSIDAGQKLGMVIVQPTYNLIPDGQIPFRDIAVSPSDFFSDAQMNSLAITVFLAGALRQRWSGFNTILIDDPVQQMDEMNVYAFLDLIRGLSGQWQFVIFTCSRDFYLLALDKLVCLNKSKQGTFRAYRLEGIAPAELKVHCDAP